MDYRSPQVNLDIYKKLAHRVSMKDTYIEVTLSVLVAVDQIDLVGVNLKDILVDCPDGVSLSYDGLAIAHRKIGCSKTENVKKFS